MRPHPSRVALYKDAIRKWGFNSQQDMIIEELVELIHAILKFDRETNEDRLDKIAEEIADVFIMLEQAQVIYGEGYYKNPKDFIEQVQGHMTAKLTRLKNRIMEQA